MSLDTIPDLLVHNLRDLLDAEKQLVAALLKMAERAASPHLREAFKAHLTETKGHVIRLETAFAILGVLARDQHCKGMAGLIEECTELLQEKGHPAVRDAGLLGVAQKIEHYEIAGYGSVITYARLVGEPEVAKLLSRTLSEEKAADEKLSAIAEADVNRRAIAPSDDSSNAG